MLPESKAANTLIKEAVEKRSAPPRKSADAVNITGVGINTGIRNEINKYILNERYGPILKKIPEVDGIRISF